MSSSAKRSERVIGHVYVVRHGETQENRDGVIQGQKDTKLNEAGERQAGMVAQRFRDVKIDWAVSSDLERAVKTAEVVMDFHKDVELEKDKRLRERGLGELEGHKVGLQRVGGQKGVEGALQFRARAVEWWDERVVGRMKEGETGIVVSHGGWITTLLRALLESGRAVGAMAGKCRNASISRIDVLSDSRAVLVAFADVSHLDTIASSTLTALQSNADEIHT